MEACGSDLDPNACVVVFCNVCAEESSGVGFEPEAVRLGGNSG